MAREFKNREDTVTSSVKPLLAHKLHGWTLSEQQLPFVEDATHPDMMAVRSGRETIAIEAKAYTNVTTIDEIRGKYMGKALTSDYVGTSDTLEVILVLRYPQDVMEAADIPKSIVHTEELEYCLVTKNGEGDFPASGFVKGTLNDVATALSIGASPAKHIADAANKMADGMEVAAAWLHDAIDKTPEIGAVLNEILDEKVTEETCAKACLIITDAFVFQNSIAGKRVLIRRHGKLRWLFPHQVRETDEKVDASDADEEVREKRQNALPRPLSYYASANRNVRRDSVMNDWEEILSINYAPIFADALRMVDEAFMYDMQMSRRVLKQLWATAHEICKSHLPQIHELAGEIFQRLIVDRKYVKSNYTLPESAALLSALVCPKLEVTTFGKLPKVADFACGTGSLLNGVYKQIQRLYERQCGRSARKIHRWMMEKNLGGVDIYPHATHLTSMTLASAFPDIPIGESRVLKADCGETKDGRYATGALDLLDEPVLPGIEEYFSFDAERVSGKEIKLTKLNPEFEDGEMDIVIMNPPYLRDSADNNSKNPKSLFESNERSKSEKKAMQQALRKKTSRIANGKVAYSYFVELAENKLKTGGRMGMILPATVLASEPFKKVREMWAMEYHDVVVITIAQRGGHSSAFSHDTNMAECMIVATKGIGKNTGRAKFVCLTERPKSILEGHILAVLIHRHTAIRQLEDGTHGGDRLMFGKNCKGQMLDCPIDAGVWGASRVKSMSLMQIAHQLSRGQLRLPDLPKSESIPICKIGNIGELGRQVSDKRIGAFDFHRSDYTAQEGTDALWHLDNITPQRSIQVLPDYKARINPQNTEKAHQILSRQNSRTHYHQFLRFTSNSVLSHWTESPALGANLITNVKMDESKEAVWTLWTNSTLGLLCHWAISGKQQSGRGLITSKKQLQDVTTLDVHKLSDAQLKSADNILNDLKMARLRPYNECNDDEWRHVLDARLLAEVLDITDPEVHAAMHKLREMLTDEPSIAGDKEDVCSFERDKKDADKRNVPYDYDDAEEAQALVTQQWELEMLDIYLPNVTKK